VPSLAPAQANAESQLAACQVALAESGQRASYAEEVMRLLIPFSL